jgi:hypothetical protein
MCICIDKDDKNDDGIPGNGLACRASAEALEQRSRAGGQYDQSQDIGFPGKARVVKIREKELAEAIAELVQGSKSGLGPAVRIT